MPELPEVETVARQLAPRLAGRTVRGLRILDPRLRDGRTPRVAGRRVVGVDRSGKRVRIALSVRPGADDPLWLAVHLRMTGRLIWSPDGGARSYMRARFDLDRGALLFLDTRRFGTFTWYRTLADSEPEGLDPLSPGLTPARLEKLLGDSKQEMKAWLLRQDRLVGLGNIYASEILYRARISPTREARSLERSETRKLLTSTRTILRRAIANCGTTFSDFQDARGDTGSYQQYLAVYDREDEPCRSCRTPIRRLVQQQRSTYLCPTCQY